MTIPAAPREAFPTVSTTIEGTWFVKTSRGVLSLSLDELDEAFQRGDVDADTKVFTSGMAAWDTLGRVAHLDGGDAREVAPTDSVTHDETSEIILKPLGASFPPPTNTHFFGTGGSAWASISSLEPSEPQEPAEGHTVVRRSTGIMPYPLRKAAGKLADVVANLRHSHPRLAVAGPWLFGAALSGIFVIGLYQFGVAKSEPAAKSPATKSAATSVRATVSPEPAVEKPASTPTVTQSSLSALSPAKGSLAAHLAAGAADRRSSDGVTIRPIGLDATSAEAERPSPRATAKAKAKKAGKKHKAQRKSKARKRRSASLD